MGFLRRFMGSLEEQEEILREKEEYMREASYDRQISDDSGMSGEEYARRLNDEIRRELSR